MTNSDIDAMSAEQRNEQAEAQPTKWKRDTHPRLPRFEDFVERIPWSGCWIWMGATKPSAWNYGKFWFDGSLIHAHRVSWMLYRGEIPDGMFVCHTCDVPLCVNPAHLFLGTPADNMADMAAKGRDLEGRITQGRKISRLSEDQVLAIRASTLSGSQLGKIYGVSRTTIHSIKNRSIHKHIENDG